MNTLHQGQNVPETQWVIDRNNGMPMLDRSSYGRPDVELMDNLHAILTLSLIFFEKIVKPFDDRTGMSTFNQNEGDAYEARSWGPLNKAEKIQVT